MRKLLFVVACFGLLALPVMAQSNVPAWYISDTNTDGSLESGWVVSIPAGSSDYFNVRFDNETGKPLAGIGIGSADFASGTAYPRAGLYDPNLTVDPTGNTPDLTSGVSAGPVLGGGAVFNYVFGPFTTTPASAPKHMIVQFPPGDSGLLGVGQDDNPPKTNFSGWSLDGFATPSNAVGGNLGLNAVRDVIAELQALGGCHAQLHIYLSSGDETGDFVTATAHAGNFFGIAFHGSCSGTLWILFLSFLGAPIQKASGIIPTLSHSGGCYFRAGTSWPIGFGGFTFNFVGVAGVSGVKGTVHISSEITVKVAPDPGCNWGVKDDGTYEAGYVVSIPAGSSDFFNNNYTCYFSPGVNNVIDYKVPVMDFGTTASVYPSSGVFEANYGIDPSGGTPDLAAGHQVGPYTFPAGTFCTTASQDVVKTFASPIPYSTFPTDDVHAVIQFPPGDAGLLGVGTDTNSTITSGSAWTLDGYSTPANQFALKFGLRLGSN